MADSGVADCIISAASRRSRRHHFISSRLSEWLLTGVLTLAPPQLASNQIRVSQGCGFPWAQQHHWRAGDGEGVDFIHDYIRFTAWASLSAGRWQNRHTIISVKGVYLPDVFLVSPWHKASDAALHRRQQLKLCYLYLKSNPLSLWWNT